MSGTPSSSLAVPTHRRQNVNVSMSADELTSPMTGSHQASSIRSPVLRLVDRVLNEHCLHLLPSLVSETFLDEDRILGLPLGHRGLLQLAQFLSQPGVDIHFTIESLIAQGELVTARIFGEGTVQKPALTLLGPAPELRGVRSLHVQVNTVSMFCVCVTGGSCVAGGR